MKYLASEKCELKRELMDDVKLEIIAFLNSYGGTIYIGVQDDGIVYEPFLSESKDSTDIKLTSWIQEQIYPTPYNLVRYHFNAEGILVIEVTEGDKKPYFLKEKGPISSGVYKRFGSAKRPATEEQIVHMIMETNHYDFESEISENQDLTFRQFERICEKKGIEITNELKVNFGIINNEDKYTNIGLLMSDQSEIVVKLAEYDNKLNFKVKKVISGSLLKIIDEVEEQVERLNYVSAVIDGSSFQKIETKSYPSIALREMVLNAFCHANYFLRSNIKIEFFADKVRIVSPGGVYKSTLEDVMQGKQIYCNPKLVNILDKMGIIKKSGMGIKTTLEAYEGKGCMPTFDTSEYFFTVELPNLNVCKYNDQINDQIKEQINDTGLEILKLVKANPGIKVPEMVKRLGTAVSDINADKIRNTIRRELKGHIRLIGSRKTGGYHLIKATEED